MRFPDDYPLIVGHENRGAEIIVEIIVHSIAGDVNHGQAGLIYVKIFFSQNLLLRIFISQQEKPPGRCQILAGRHREIKGHFNGRRTVYLPTLRCKAALGQIAAKINKSSTMNTADCCQIIQLFDQALVHSRLPQACCALCGLKSPVAKINMQIGRRLICQRASFK